MNDMSNLEQQDPITKDEALAFYLYLRTGTGELVICGRGVDGYSPTYTGTTADHALKTTLARLAEQQKEQP